MPAQPYIRVDGSTCSAKNTMLRAIAQQGHNTAALLGSTPLQKAHVRTTPNLWGTMCHILSSGTAI